MKRLLSIIVAYAFALTLYANVGEQSYGEKWRAYFIKAWSHSMSDQCMKMADTMYAEGKKHNDAHLMCRALSVKTNYMFYNPDKGDVIKITDQLKQLSRKDRVLYPYYYFASLYSVGWHIAHKQLIKAMREEHAVEQLAKNDNLKFGYHCMHIINSLIYAHNGEYDKVLEQSKYAMNNALDDNDRYRAYQSMVLSYNGMQIYDKSLDCVERMYGYSASDWNRFYALYQKCMILYFSGKHNEYPTYYDKLNILSGKIRNKESDYMLRAQIYNLCCKKQYDKAMQIADSRGMPFLNEQVEVMKAKGDYPKALRLFMKRLRYEDSLACTYTYNDFSEIDREVGNMAEKKRLNSIQQQNMQTEIENTHLQTLNSELALQQAQARTKLMQENTLNSNLLIIEKENVLKHLKFERHMSRIKEDNAESEYRYHRNVLCIGIVALILITALGIGYLVYKRKMEKIINKKNKELAKACKLAEESQQRKQAFLKSISHEIRTPINAIVGFTDVLTTHGLVLDEAEKEDIKMRIRTNSQHLQTLVSDILDTKGLETGKIGVNIESVKVNDVCRLALSFVKERCDVKNLKLYFNTDVDDDYTIETDSRRLQQVLINYLTNAEKNTSEGYIRLSFSTVERKDWLVFSVEDTGCGVPEDKADTIFKRFEKVNKFVQGAGMGLYMCRIIAKRLKGKAELDRMYHGGARFLFMLKQFAMLLFMLMTTTAAMAQLHSLPELVALNDRAKQLQASPECLPLADSLYNLAIAHKDRDMQCLALYIPIIHYQRVGNFEAMSQSCDKMMECAMKYNLSHHFYLPWFVRINYLFVMGRTAEALRQLNAMREHAVKAKDSYGQARCYRVLGNLYLRKGNYSIAIKNFEDELHIIEHGNTAQDVGDVLQRMGVCQKYLGQYEQAARTFDKAILLSKYQRVRDENKMWRAIVAFMLDDRTTFSKYYDELSRDSLALNTVNATVVGQLRMFHYITLGQWSEALEICYAANPANIRYMLLSDYYYFQGDSRKALEMKEKRLTEERKGTTDIQLEDIAQYLSRMTKDQMDIEKLQLEQESRMLNVNNEQLNLHKLQLQLNNAKDRERILSTINANSKLKMKAQDSKIEHAKAQVRIKQQEDELDKARQQRTIYVMLVVGAGLLVMLAMVGYVVYHRRNNVKILNEKNRQLQAELEKVYKSDRTQEEFLLQMSHEVNEPLNAITGFSELLLRDIYKDDEEGKMSARKIVDESSQKLLNIVADAVDKAMK